MDVKSVSGSLASVGKLNANAHKLSDPRSTQSIAQEMIALRKAEGAKAAAAAADAKPSLARRMVDIRA